MAVDHVPSENKAKNSIFPIFTQLLKSKSNNEKTSIFLFDTLKSDPSKIGSVSTLSYTSKRLVRSLASSQPKRQSTVFATLTAGLQSNVLSVQSVFDALDSEVTNGPTKSEHGMSLTISVLSYGAIIKSGIFANLPIENQEIIVKKLIDYGKQKQYLRNAVSAFFVELLQTISKTTFKTVIWPIVKEETEQSAMLNDEWYAVLFLSAWSFPKSTEKYLVQRFGSKMRLSEEIIMRSAYYPKIVQESILALLFSSLSCSNKELVRLWKLLLSKEHKITPKWGIFLVTFCKRMLDLVDDPSVCIKIIRPKILKIILMSQRKPPQKGDKFIFTCRAVLEVLVARLTAADVDKRLSLQVLKMLLFEGDLNFDKMTKTRTIHLLFENLSVDDIKEFSLLLQECISGNNMKTDSAGNKVDWLARERQVLFAMLGRTTIHPALQKEPDFVLNIVKFLFDTGFLEAANVNSESKRLAKDVFFKVAELHNLKMESAVSLLNNVLLYVDSKLSMLGVELSEEALVGWKNVLAANSKLQKQGRDKKCTSLRLLLLHMGLHLFRDAELASSTVKELLQCYKRIEKDLKSSNVSLGEEPHWVEVIVDLFLDLLSRDNKLLRHVVNSVFPNIATQLTPTGLQQIIDALDPSTRNNVLGHADSDVSDDEDDDDGDDLDDSDSDLEDEETERETVNDKLRMAVRNALGYSAALTDDESVDMDDMNEDEEIRLNESLANAFRLFRATKHSKKKQSKDDETRTHFRVRVLDLVEIIVTTNPSLGTCIDLLPPLLALLEFSIKDPHQKPLQNRLESVLRKLSNNKKFQNVEEVNLTNITDAFKGMFEREASGLIYHEMAPILVDCCGFFVRASQYLSKDDASISLEECYVDLLNRHFKSNDRKVSYGIFPAVLRMLWDGNWIIAKRIMALLLDQELKMFKKLKLLDLLEIFYKNDRLQSTATDDRKTALSSAESKFVKKLSKLQIDLSTPASKSKLATSFYSRLLQLVQVAVALLKKYRNECPTVPAWNLVIEKLVEHRELLSHQKTKGKLQELTRLYNIPMPASAKKEGVPEQSNYFNPEKSKGQKRKILKEDENIGECQEEKLIKKKKKSHRSRQLAKESRNLREAVSSQGLKDMSFSSISILDVQEEADAVPSKKRRSIDGKKKEKG